MIAKEGWIFIFISLGLTLLFIWGATRWDSKTAFISSMFFGLLTIFIAFFFRDPERIINIQPYGIISPADGKVVVVKQLDSHPFVGDSAIQVSIFLSVFNVHVNRIPATGKIEYVNYNEGEFLPAFEDKASMANEQTEIGMITESGQKVAFKQIAGIIARRIVCYLTGGESVNTGDRFGLIRFGSRADIILPVGSNVKVKVGDIVTGGETVIGLLRENKVVPDSVSEKSGGADEGL